MDEERFLALVGRLQEAYPEPLDAVQAAVLIACSLGLCSNSRSFARWFDISHSLALRACHQLADGDPLIEILDRDEKTQRQTYRLTDTGHAAISRVTSEVPD